MLSNRKFARRTKLLALAVPASLACTSGAFAQALGTTAEGNGQISISTAGSTALKNWFVAKTTTFTDITPADARLASSGQFSVNGVSYPLASPNGDNGAAYWNNGLSYQLAPKTNTAVHTPGGTQNQDNAVLFTYHESGSVEGILELASDQIAPVAYVTANVDRNPEGGNAVWENYNQIGASGTTAGAAFNATTGSSVNGYTLGNFYGSGVGQTGTPGVTTTWVPGSASNPTATFTNVNGAGINVNGGQNAVQVALSDAYPQQVFKNDYANTANTFTPVGSLSSVTQTGTANTSFNSNPLDIGYGQGNSSLPAGSLGTAGSRATYQSPSILNMPATATNPRTGAAFGTGAWNNATNGGLGNLNAQLIAVTATAFVANPGTGVTQVDRTDADWIETTSHFANGASFNMTTRDVNSGTRDVSSLDTGVDPTFSTGKNDNGNGILPSAVNPNTFDQTSVGSTMRFSNKTAGGAQLRPTVQNNRMALGTLSINDAGGNDTQSADSPVRVLSYSDSTDGSSPYVSPNYITEENGTYVIFQNEVAATLKNPDANYATNTVVTGQGGAQVLQGKILGDDNSGDVANMLNQSELAANIAIGSASAANSADGLISQGYILPNVMQVTKNINGQGLNNSVAGQIATGSISVQANPNFDASLAAAANVEYATSLPVLGAVTTGTNSKYGDKGSTFAKTATFYNGGTISITNNNFLFGNFNQSGIRDFNAIKSAVNADEALISADIAVGASVPGSEFTSQGDNNGVAGGTNGISNTALVSYGTAQASPTTISTLSKGDLIVMGDFNGDGHFDGADLVAMAEDAALSTNYSTDTLASSANMYQTGVLNKNTAMDYMNTNIPQHGAVGSNATTDYIRTSGAAILESSAVPFGATPITNPITHAAVIDPVTGNAEFTYDPSGVNTFNKSDVNQDGVVDFNDAVTVNNVIGKNPATIGDQIGATQQAPLSGATIPLNLYMAQQVDGGGTISQADLNVVNTALTGSGSTNWYGYNVHKTGSGNITWARTGGTVTVYPGASFQISSGIVQIGGTQDPFTDNNAGGVGSTAGNQVAVAIDSGAKMQITQNFKTVAVSGLSIDTASNSTLDIGNSTVIINYGVTDPISSIQAYIASGFNNGGFNGPAGIISSAVTDPTKFGIGYADSADPGNPAGLASGQIEVTYTLLGDANLDHKVNGTDFAILATNFNKAANGWDQGDFNYDNKVNGTDFAFISSNFNQGTGGAVVGSDGDVSALDAFAAANGLVSNVPEPTTVSLAIVAGLGILSRRRRRN